MSKQDLWSAIGRARADLTFNGRLQNDLGATIKQEGYALEPDELDTLRGFLMPQDGSQMGFSPGTPPPPPEVIAQIQLAELRSALDLHHYGFDMIKATFNSARSTYRTITWMNRIMFAIGIGMFVAAGVWAVYSESEKVYSILFGGLGVASFVALFMLKPMENSQKALSNLVQVEIAFMGFTDQVTWWENFARIPKGIPPMPDPANIERASKALQVVTRDTIAMVQTYLVDANRADHASENSARLHDD